MQGVLDQVGQALLTALLLPTGIAASLVVVRLLTYFQRIASRSQPLPIVVHPLNFEHNMRDFMPQQRADLLELPSRLRDFISDDSELDPRLAPGPVSR